MDKVSIIVPVYNVAPYLKRCVDSLTGQTYENVEILLIDDGSPDESGAICDALANADSRIRVFHQVNQGVSAARNAGLDAAAGDWICFCDGDDWYQPEFIEKMLLCAETESADYIICDYQITADKKPPVVSGSTAELTTGCDPRLAVAVGPISSCTHMIHRRLFENSGVRYPISCRQYEELPVIPVLAKYASRIGIVAEPLYCYYQRGDGSSASNTAKNSRKNFLAAFALMQDALGADYRTEAEFHAIYALLYGEILLCCKRGASSAEIRKEISEYQNEYPNYTQNPYLPMLGCAKHIFLWFERRRCIWGLRLLAKIHSLIVG